LLPLGLALSLLGQHAFAGTAGQQTLTILHTSEHHGQSLPIEQRGHKRVGGMAGRAALVGQIRSEQGNDSPMLLLDSGDILIGTAMSSFFRGEPDILAMNAMGYQAMAAGNHEFDFGLDHLRHLQALARFPILCSNLTSHTTELPCRTSAILQIGPIKVGLLGLLGRRNFPDTFNREVASLLDLIDSVEAAREGARRLRAEGAALIVAITHEDTDEDLTLLNSAPEIDVIIGGHTPGFDGLRVRGGVNAQERATAPSGVFVKTHREGRTLGRLDLELARAPDDRAIIATARARNLPVTEDILPEPAVADLLQSYAKKLEEQSGRVVGRSLVTLDGEIEHIRTRETNLGNLLADLLRAEFRTDIALINSGQIRDSIPPGPVELRRLLRVLPFQSSIVTFTLTGRQLRDALENSASLLPSTAGRFLQISGVTVVFDPSAPAGSRVRELRIGDRSVEEHRRYSVTTDAFLADGGDGYTMFAGAEDRIERQIPIRDLLLHTLAAGPLKASVDGRIGIRRGAEGRMDNR
jgi:5'-nucleotidase / UDP-sugar diphosphatase